MKKTLLILLVILLLIVGGVYWYMKQNGVLADEQNPAETTDTQSKGTYIYNKLLVMDSKGSVILFDTMTNDLSLDKSTFNCQNTRVERSYDSKTKVNWSNSKIPLNKVIYKDQIGQLNLVDGRAGTVSPIYTDRCYTSYIVVNQGWFTASGAVPAKDACAYDYNGDKVLNDDDSNVLANMWRDKTEITQELITATIATDLKAALTTLLEAKKTTIEYDDVFAFQEKLTACPTYQK
jgi:hypothetical protein